MKRTPGLAIVALAWCAVAMGDDPKPLAIPPESVIREFDIGKDGDALVVPVQIMNAERPFLVDTGATLTTFEFPSTDGLKVLGKSRTHTMHEVVETTRYAVPKVSLRGIPVALDEGIGASREKDFGEQIGHPIEGVLAMDFLKEYIVHVDFDRGKLFFLKEVPKEAGERVPTVAKRDAQYVLADMGAGKPVSFLIDTGAIMLNSGTLLDSEALELERQGRALRWGTGVAIDHQGREREANVVFMAQKIKLGGITYGEPLLGASNVDSVLGLGFWSRFAVTFDFPNHCLYLRPGRSFGLPDAFDRSGITLTRAGGTTVLSRVDRPSQGYFSGLRTGDVLLKLGRLDAATSSLFDLRAALALAGTYRCVVKRGDRILRINLYLHK